MAPKTYILRLRTPTIAVPENASDARKHQENVMDILLASQWLQYSIKFITTPIN